MIDLGSRPNISSKHNFYNNLNHQKMINNNLEIKGIGMVKGYYIRKPLLKGKMIAQNKTSNVLIRAFTSELHEKYVVLERTEFKENDKPLKNYYMCKVNSFPKEFISTESKPVKVRNNVIIGTPRTRFFETDDPGFISVSKSFKVAQKKRNAYMQQR